MRGALSDQHRRPDVPDEQLLRRRVHVVRPARHESCRTDAGAARRSDGVRIPASDQVPVPQVRCVRIYSEARRTVHSAVEHGEREDVHLHLVLVRDPGDNVGRIVLLSVSVVDFGQDGS